MTSDPPRVSVLVPLYNHAAYIEACLDTLAADTYPHLEVVIIDDGSSDASYDVAQAWRRAHPEAFEGFVLERQENRGINRTLNRALEHARGPLIAILASDDQRVPGTIGPQAQLFRESPRLKVVYANGRHWYPQAGEIHGRVHDAAMVDLLERDPATVLDFLYTHIPALYIQSCLFRKDFLCAIGGFDETVIADDWVLNIRIFQAVTSNAEFAYLDEDVFLYRHHDTNVHANLEGQLQRILQVADTYTPAEKRRAFRSEIFLEFTFRAVSRNRFRLGLDYLWTSQKILFSPRRLLDLARRLVDATLRRTRRRLGPHA